MSRVEGPHAWSAPQLGRFERRTLSLCVVFDEARAVVSGSFPIIFRVGSIERGRATFTLPGIVFTDVHERLKVSGFRAFVGSDVSGIRFIVSSVGVNQDLVRPVRSKVASITLRSLVVLVGFTRERLGAG